MKVLYIFMQWFWSYLHNIFVFKHQPKFKKGLNCFIAIAYYTLVVPSDGLVSSDVEGIIVVVTSEILNMIVVLLNRLSSIFKFR